MAEAGLAEESYVGLGGMEDIPGGFQGMSAQKHDVSQDLSWVPGDLTWVYLWRERVVESNTVRKCLVIKESGILNRSVQRD